MTENVHNDWDLRSEEVQKDQVAAYDAMRRRCPVALDEFMGYSVGAAAGGRAARLRGLPLYFPSNVARNSPASTSRADV